ncbi:MAG: type II toxin-antitoxin system RelE/ParE family toxin [Bauldia sp.]|nr:type II toxin-antitoxin system RelE/ParE family toxin [Bauldia sp.]
MKTVSYRPNAIRQMSGLPPDIRDRINAKVVRYAATGAGDVKALKGAPSSRLRVGDYRIVFDETAVEVLVLAVAHRSEVYRR